MKGSGWFFFACLTLIVFSLSGCGGNGAVRYLSMPPQSSPEESLQGLDAVVTRLGFFSRPVRDRTGVVAFKMGNCAWFEDQELAAIYEHARYSNLTMNVMLAVPSKQYCFEANREPSYSWLVSGYMYQGKWVRGWTLPPNSSWKPGDHLFKRGILVIQFIEFWGRFDRDRDFTPEAASLLDQLRAGVLQRFGPDSIHLFTEETRRHPELYVAY